MVKSNFIYPLVCCTFCVAACVTTTMFISHFNLNGEWNILNCTGSSVDIETVNAKAVTFRSKGLHDFEMIDEPSLSGITLGPGELVTGRGGKVVLIIRTLYPDYHIPQIGDVYTTQIHDTNGVDCVYVGTVFVVGVGEGRVLEHEYWLTPNGNSWGYYNWEQDSFLDNFTYQCNWKDLIKESEFK